MDEIRFRQSEDLLTEAIQMRRKALCYCGVPCSTCGSHNRVMANILTGDTQCERCFADEWVKRRFKEEM